MNLESEKIKLLDDILRIKDIELVHQLRDILNKERAEKYTLTVEQLMVLRERKKAHQEGRSKSYSWEEVKELVRNS